VQRAGEITRRTLSYHRAARVASDVNIIEIIQDVLQAKSKRLESRRIAVRTGLQDVPTLSGYAGELRQVFENLIENAIDAVRADGHIGVRIRTRRYHGQEHILVSVCDSAAGMSPYVLARIFDPFFTTKPQTGSGLGLWVARGIVRSHGGNIRARSRQTEHRHGTVFTVLLPVQRTGSEHLPKTTTVHAA
jgi:signal transduction histidine kinase